MTEYIRRAMETSSGRHGGEAMKGPRPLVILACAVWACVVVGGVCALWAYEAAPSPAAAAPVAWPADSALRRVAGEPTLVMLAHPRCPCTRASIGELAKIRARCKGRLHMYVLFIKPGGFERDWEKTDLWRSAADIPGVEVVSDEGGAEARRFGAATSGQALLYDGLGRLVFSGGITPSRGHYGDNDGADAIVSLSRGASVERNRASVFGCPLFADKDRRCEAEGVR